MRYFKSAELKRFLSIQIILSICCILIMAFLFGKTSALTTMIICLLFIMLSLLENYKRSRHMTIMSEQIDQILHGRDVTIMQDCTEGDTAILATQINKMFRRLKEQTDQLSADKILMADYLADISHQIKTPLTSIRLILTFLQEEQLTKQRRLELIQELSNLVNRVEWLVYALLRMSKLDAGTITLQNEKISIAEHWKRAYNTLSIPLDLRDITFDCQIENSLSMYGDIAWTTEAMENILKNCMEHTPAGGKISVTATENPLYTLIRIEDTGTGIDEEDLPHIFERFYRGKHSDTQSVGIGLALSRRIITAQSGTIQAGNRKGQNGAFFEIRFYKSAI